MLAQLNACARVSKKSIEVVAATAVGRGELLIFEQS